MTDAYPLYWPEGWPRTRNRESSRFQPHGLAAESQRIINELHLLGARNSVISTNVALRRDGLPYSSQKAPDDPGVAVYFTLNGRQQCIPCDRWAAVEENARAIWKSIEALRGLDRWGAKSFVDAAFRGFEALPAPGQKRQWWEVMGFPPGVTVTADEIKAKFRELARKHHPDKGGSTEMYQEIVAARDEGLRACQ